MNMTNKKTIEIREAASLASRDIVKQQVASGKPKSGMPKVRHIAIVAKTLIEMLDSYAEEDREEVLRAALAGSLLNCSQLRQDMERAGILTKDAVIDNQY